MSSRTRSFRHTLNTLLLGITFATIWSLSFIATKTALADISPLALTAIRLLLAGAVLFVIKANQTARFIVEQPMKTLFSIIGAGLLSQGLYLAGSYWALVNMPTSVVNIVVSTLPLVTLPFAFIILHEKVHLSSVLAFLLGIVGVAMTLAGGVGVTTPYVVTYGVPAGILLTSVLALALGNVLVKPLVNTANLGPLCAIQFLSSGFAAFIVSTWLEPTASTDITPSVIQSVLFLSFVGSIFGTIIWFKLLDRMPAGTASSFFLLTPIFGICFGWLFFGESVTIHKVTGVLIICSAILMITSTTLTTTVSRIAAFISWKSRKKGL